MKTKSSGEKSSFVHKKSKNTTKKKDHSSNTNLQPIEREERAKLIDPATQTSKKSNEIYTIDSIEGFMNFNSNPFYLVHWKGYDRPDDMTWEPEKDIDNCDILINKFWTKRFAIQNSKSSLKIKPNLSHESNNNNDIQNKNADPNSLTGEDINSSENESTDGNFTIIRSQYQEIMRLKKERKDFLRQIKILKQSQTNGESTTRKNADLQDDSNLDEDNTSNEDHDMYVQSEHGYDSDSNYSENSTSDIDSYDTDVNSKLDNGYIPDYILKSRCQNSKQQYLVKWSGFDDKDATWVNAEMIDEQYVNIYHLVYCSPMVKQTRIVFMNEKRSIHQYNVLFDNGQLAWLSEGQIKQKLLFEFNSRKKFSYYMTNT